MNEQTLLLIGDRTFKSLRTVMSYIHPVLVAVCLVNPFVFDVQSQLVK